MPVVEEQHRRDAAGEHNESHGSSALKMISRREFTETARSCSSDQCACGESRKSRAKASSRQPCCDVDETTTRFSHKQDFPTRLSY
jgi:hypothetical protein